MVSLYSVSCNAGFGPNCRPEVAMKKLMLPVLFLFVFLSQPVHATPQIPDILSYDGKEYPIQTDFLYEYFMRFPERNPKNDEESCSALWRGYRSTFEVSNGRIYLKDIVGNICFGTPASQLKKVVPGGGRLFVDWVSDLVHAGYGENNEDPYGLESLDAYEKYSFFEVEKGQVLAVRHFDNKGYRRFKKRQFEAFRKRTEYEPIVKEILTRNPKMKRGDADANIQLRIFSYTKKFLVDDGKRRVKALVR